MMRRLFMVVVVAPLIAAACAGRMPVDIPGLLGQKQSDPEKIVAVLDDVQRGMQSRRILKVLAHISKNYQDEEGRDYEAIQAFLNTTFKKYRKISVTRVRPKVFVEGDQARALETFGTIAKPFDPQDPPINVHGQMYVYLEKVDDTWLITRWGRLL